MPVCIERHDDRQLCRCGRGLCLRQLNGESLLRHRLQAVHHKEDEQEKDDVDHRYNHELRLLFEAVIAKIHYASQLSFLAVTIVVQRRSVSVTIVSS